MENYLFSTWLRGTKTDFTVWTVELPVRVNLMLPSIVQVFSVTPAFETATIILCVAGVRSSTRKRRLTSVEVGFGRFFLCLRSAILRGLLAILMMTWGGPLSSSLSPVPEAAVLLKGLKHDSMMVDTCGILDRSLAAFAAARRGFRTTS